ncbi:hypothetical protein JCM9279_004018 [Rhodotorula babjevae]
MQVHQAPTARDQHTHHASTTPLEDPVLHRLVLVYGWWLACLEGPEYNSYRKSATSAITGFEKGWGILLPSERDRALDLVVSSWCSWQVDRSQLDPEVVIKLHTAETEHVKLLALSRNILHLYPNDDVKAWFVSLFPVGGRYGVTTAKLRRVPQNVWYLFQQTIDTGLVWLREGVSARQALPSVDLLYDTAYRATQTVSERYAIFHRCVEDLLSLYSAGRLDEHVSRAGRAAYLEQVRSVLLHPDEEQRLERRLDVAVQLSAVELARAWLFTACTRHAQAQRLPKLEDLARELYLSTGNDAVTAQLALAPPPTYHQEHARRHAAYVIREAPSAAPHDPVLHRLLGLYSFWLVSLKGADNNSRRKSLKVAADSFRAKWGMLLPSERDELVDVLASKYCLWQLDPTQVDLDEIVSYRRMSDSVKHPIPSISKLMTESERATLATVARGAVRAKPSAEVQAWYDQLFEDRDGGIRPIKLLRVPQDGWPILNAMLEHVSKRLLEDVPVAQALPPADLLFSTVHLAFETPRDRRKIFKDRIIDLLNLYASIQPPVTIAPHQYHAYLGLVRTTFFWVAEDEHFEAQLMPALQIAAVQLVRERLFDVCALYHAHGSLPAHEPLLGD